jgi:hypothetical protein
VHLASYGTHHTWRFPRPSSLTSYDNIGIGRTLRLEETIMSDRRVALEEEPDL